MKYLITGASRGIGKFLFDYFTKKGHDTFGTFWSTELTNEAKSSNLFKVNLSDPNSVKTLFESLPLEKSELIVINCAGINHNGFTHKFDLSKWSDVIDVNLKGAFYLSHFALPLMREQKFGRIIFFSSVVPQLGVPGTSAYAASKSGLWGLAKTIAKENAALGITANCINLGYFDIGMIEQVPDNLKGDIKQKIPIGRFGDPSNIIKIVEFLIESDYTTGTSIDCNGGLV